ncbi:DUF89 domain-containing protein [Rhodotorula toruloides]
MSRAGKKVRLVPAPVQHLPAKLTAPLRRTSLLTSRSSQERSQELSRALRRILSSVRAVIHLASGGERVVLTPSLSRADLKTQTQFAHRTDGKPPGLWAITKQTYARQGILGFYSGVGALVTGNALKAGVRFVSYDRFKQMLVDQDVTGLGAGMMEAVFAVTPSETIKTKLIDDQKREVPRYRGLVHGTVSIIKEEGFRGIYRGLGPVAARQGANSAVRFTTYGTLKSFVSGNSRPGETLPAGVTFAIGAIAGVVTVYATMPLDVIKTRMQSLEARSQYRNSFHCAARIFSEEGIFRFWRGATPRLARLVLSGGIVFTVYEKVKRWPIILTGVVDELNKINGTLSGSNDDEQAKMAEGKQLINDISGLIYEMRHDRDLSPLQATGLPDDTAAYNDELAQLAEKGENKWFSAPWLFAECYLYRRLRGLFAVTKHWNLFDPFASQKLSTWRSSAVGAAALAKSLQKLVQEGPVNDEKKLKLDLLGMLEVDLWGNATDLSLLTSLTHEEIQQLQSVERGQHFVLKTDFERTWEHFKTLKDARVDIVLDNSGFELYTDMVLADWLVTLSPYVSEVVFHPKLIPWFVSDVQPHDFLILLDTLDDASFFPADSGLTEEDRTAFRELAARWKRYVKEGKFRLSLLSELQKASLVIFKGDLNYRKLVGDAWWPTTTPFDDALGPLRGKIDILSLRTCKADTVVGLPEGTEERVEKEDPKWRINGK